MEDRETIEKIVISALNKDIKCIEHCIKHNVSTTWFSNEDLQWIFELSKTIYNKYSMVCTRLVFIDKSKPILSEPRFEKNLKLYDNLSDTHNVSLEEFYYYFDKLSEIVLNEKVLNAIQNYINKSEVINPNITELVDELHSEIQTITMMRDISSSEIADFNQIDREKVKAVEAIVEGLLGPGTCLLSGDPRTHKSMIALLLAISIYLGEDFLDKFKIKQKGRTIYFSFEDSFQMVCSRLSTLLQSKKDKADIICYQDYPDHYRGGYVGIKRMLQNDTTIRLIIIDVLGNYFIPHRVNEYGEAKRFMKCYTDLGQEFNCAIMFLHHNKKDISTTSDGLSSIGSVGLNGGATHNWNFFRDKKNQNIKFTTNNKYGFKDDDIVFQYSQDGEMISYTIENSTESLEHKFIVNLLEEHPGKEFTINEIQVNYFGGAYVDLAFGPIPGRSVRTVYRYLQILVENGRINHKHQKYWL